ncbi:MAG: hypothetical protein PQJ46_12090, partial [Spirochaetales bacterium]|nr:hypothetical protein [Spirochaetales bacterium]
YLGRLNEAEKMYYQIIYNYPSSYKVEACNYRLSMIEQKYREQSLVDLLKMTHEEYLKSLDEFQLREKTYENALDSYQKRLAYGGASASNDEQIKLLKERIAELEKQLKIAKSSSSSDTTEVTDTSDSLSTDDKVKLYELYSRAQSLKDFYISYLDSVDEE